MKYKEGDIIRVVKEQKNYDGKYPPIGLTGEVMKLDLEDNNMPYLVDIHDWSSDIASLWWFKEGSIQLANKLEFKFIWEL